MINPPMKADDMPASANGLAREDHESVLQRLELRVVFKDGLELPLIALKISDKARSIALQLDALARLVRQVRCEDCELYLALVFQFREVLGSGGFGNGELCFEVGEVLPRNLKDADDA